MEDQTISRWILVPRIDMAPAFDLRNGFRDGNDTQKTIGINRLLMISADEGHNQPSHPTPVDGLHAGDFAIAGDAPLGDFPVTPSHLHRHPLQRQTRALGHLHQSGHCLGTHHSRQRPDRRRILVAGHPIVVRMTMPPSRTSSRSGLLQHFIIS